ncbi:MAG TPA: hopanoid biosynthesis-associated protein HpnK [Steroidobacteraceae bacterium]|nr:hopanoid biosynthesis-associated protein HpnK [Steroidobacteraceae bacterium]
MRRFLIVTADDFGLHHSVNDAVEQASRAGILTAASLMVGAAAAADAVRRARTLPNLRVGLHVVLADGQAMLASSLIPGIADDSGHMDDRMLARGIRYFALPSVRRQLEAEIRAQFSAFASTGLPLDHVNVHKHFHLHPTILEMLLRIGRDYGAPAMRIPAEPAWFAGRGGAWAARTRGILLMPWISLMKARLRAARVSHNDQIFGLADSGAMNEAKLLEILARLPAGVTEIYFHPATESGAAIAASMGGYRHLDELRALQSPRVRAVIDGAGIARGGYGDIAGR